MFNGALDREDIEEAVCVFNNVIAVIVVIETSQEFNLLMLREKVT